MKPFMLRLRLTYNPDTGEFLWNRSTTAVDAWNDSNAGKRADIVTEDGYMAIPIAGRLEAAHRVAWAYMTDGWPTDVVDHIDRATDNNRWANLRSATQQQNMANRAPYGASGLKGAYFKKTTGRWFAQITIDGKCRHLGYFDTKDAAHGAYMIAANEAFGEFATDGLECAA